MALGALVLAGARVGSAVDAEKPGGPELPRVRAALAGLTYRPVDAQVVFGGQALERWRPALAPEGVRRRLGELSLAMIREGGYRMAMVERIFHGSETAARRRLESRPFRQLDQAAIPAGDDYRAMARSGAPSLPDGAEGDSATAGPAAESPGVLLYTLPLAAAYTDFPESGLAAVTHLAELIDDDFRAAPCARAAFVLLSEALAGRDGDRDALLRKAAAAAGDPETARALLAARVKDLNNLRGESTALGRLERCAALWYRSRDSRELLVDAGRELEGWEARGFAALLAGAAYGTERFPPEAVAAVLRNRPLDELAFDFRELGGGGALLAVTLPARPPAAVTLADASSQGD